MKGEALKKAIKTKQQGIKQIAEIEDTETHVVIDYGKRQLIIYTNRATVMNRLQRAGYEPVSEDKVDREIYSRTYVFPTKDIGNFMRTGIFKYD